MPMGGRAQGVSIDQRNDATSPSALFSWDLKNGFPVAQEFVPQLAGLDFVDLVMGSVEVDPGATFQVTIRQSQITGTVLGTSEAVQGFGQAAPSIAHFTFASTVPLTPGNAYVLELLYAPSRWTVGADPSAAYADGRMIGGGGSLDNYDLWFREGIGVPEASCLVLFLVGAVTLKLHTKHRMKHEFRFEPIDRQ